MNRKNSKALNKWQFWDVQVSIANALSKCSQPSLNALHAEILEEVGHPPGLDIIDYFVGLSYIPQKDIKEYFAKIGGVQKESLATPEKKSLGDEALIDKVINNGSPTVLKFRQAYLDEHGEAPQDTTIALFLQKVQEMSKSVEHEPQKGVIQFAKEFACCATPTVLRFRNAFKQRFGSFPNDAIIAVFLESVQRVPDDHKDNDDTPAKMKFAEAVASAGIPTILQFRQAFQKVYGELPSEEVIDVFIKHLSGK